MKSESGCGRCRVLMLALAAALAAVVWPSARAAHAAPWDGQRIDPDYAHAAPEAYERFADLKFGMRIVWGQNMVMGLNWDGALRKGGCSEEFRKIYLTQYQLMEATEFDANQWASLCARAGMRYALTTTKMHGGFCMWPTKTTTLAYRRTRQPSHGSVNVEEVEMHYDIMDTPLKRDVIKELIEACRKQGLPVGIHFSHADWNDPRFAWDSNNRWAGKKCDKPLSPSKWYEQHRLQILELAGNYGSLLQISFDTGGITLPPEDFPEIVKTVKLVRKLQPDCLFRNRGLGPYGDYGTPDGWVPSAADGRQKVDDSTVNIWEHIDFVAGIWGWWPGDNEIKPREWLVTTLIDTVAKGGNFMPSVSPMPSGKFAPEIVERLQYVGDWLKVNGEAIYKTRPRKGDLWKEGDGIRFTRSKDRQTIYAICLKWPGKTLTLKSVRPAEGAAITMLGVAEPLKWKYDPAAGLQIEIPDQLQDKKSRPCQLAWALRITPVQPGS